MTAPVHFIELYADRGEIAPRLVCTATPGAPCRKRPAVERESWSADDPDLTPGHPCWAIEWIEAVGFADGVTWTPSDDVIVSVPVGVSYEESVALRRAEASR